MPSQFTELKATYRAGLCDRLRAQLKGTVEFVDRRRGSEVGLSDIDTLVLLNQMALMHAVLELLDEKKVVVRGAMKTPVDRPN